MGLPSAIFLAVELGVITVVLAAAARVGRWPWLFPVLLVAALVEAFRRQVLQPSWVGESLLLDVPWAGAGRLLLVQGLVLLAARRLARYGPGRLAVVTLIAPAVAVLPSVRSALLAHVAPRELAGLVLLGTGVSSLLPALGPSAGLLGGVDLRPAAALPLVVGVVAWLRSRGPTTPVAAASESTARRAWALVPSVAAGLVVWLAIAGGVAEWFATGLEQSPVLIPRVRDLVVVTLGLLLGMIGDEGTFALLLAEVYPRAMSLRGDDLAFLLRLGLSVGSALPVLLSLGASLRLGLPFWLVQVVLVAWACA